MRSALRGAVTDIITSHYTGRAVVIHHYQLHIAAAGGLTLRWQL